MKTIPTKDQIALASDTLDRRFNISERQLTLFCRQHHIRKLSLFGSVLREDFHYDSDIDILVEFESGHVPGFAIITMENELSKILGRKVDIRTPADLSRYFRAKVVKEAKVKYEHTQS
jgi:predicted nucleotidyltransferase